MATKVSGARVRSTAKAAAVKVLKDPRSSKDAKTAAASVWSQSKGKESTSARAASAAARVLKDPYSSKSAKTAAASALTQTPKFKPEKIKSSDIDRAVARYFSKKEK